MSVIVQRRGHDDTLVAIDPAWTVRDLLEKVLDEIGGSAIAMQEYTLRYAERTVGWDDWDLELTALDIVGCEEAVELVLPVRRVVEATAQRALAALGIPKERWLAELEDAIHIADLDRIKLLVQAEDPLIYGARFGRLLSTEGANVAVVRAFVEGGVELHEESFFDRGTPLTVAAAAKNWPVVRYLVEEQAVDVNQPQVDDNGAAVVTALTLAAAAKSWRTVRFLANHGADPNIAAEGSALRDAVVAGTAVATVAAGAVTFAFGARFQGVAIMTSSFVRRVHKPVVPQAPLAQAVGEGATDPAARAAAHLLVQNGARANTLALTTRAKRSVAGLRHRLRWRRRGNGGADAHSTGRGDDDEFVVVSASDTEDDFEAAENDNPAHGDDADRGSAASTSESDEDEE